MAKCCCYKSGTTNKAWIAFHHCAYWTSNILAQQLKTHMYQLTGQLDFNFFYPQQEKPVITLYLPCRFSGGTTVLLTCEREDFVPPSKDDTLEL